MKVLLKMKHTLCLWWWTQSILKKLQEGHTEDLKAFWNSKIEVKCVNPMPESKQTRYESTGISSDWETPQHPQTYDYSVTSTLSTSRMSTPDSIHPLKKW